MYKGYIYDIFKAPNKVIAVSSYAGKTVRGVAKCAPNDKFDADKGADLAMARCGLKIAEKREARAEKKYAEALKIFKEAEAYRDKMEKYYNDAQEAAIDAQNFLDKVLEDM